LRLFDQKLLRLKHATGLTEDQDVAELLGMSRAAFSARKKRDAFPDDKVYALAAQRPEIGIDVDQVLTGDSEPQREFRRRLELIKGVTQKAAALGLPRAYTAGLQEILFFIELQDAEGVLRAIRNLASVDASAGGPDLVVGDIAAELKTRAGDTPSKSTKKK
jgi:transcriptional regulator with XRE-family HTH domain